ncbi:MAG: winged helix-turn-helix domain-containing protein [Myxococcota bacterium]
MWTMSGCVVDLERRRVERADGRVETLTTREALLLGFLVERQGVVVTRDELLRDAFGYHADTMSRAVDTIVHRLRIKLERDPARPVHLLTEYGAGYRLLLATAPATATAPAAAGCPPISFAGGSLALDTGRLTRPDGSVELVVGVELALARELVRAAGPTVDRQQLERRVWGTLAAGSNRLRNLVHRLRTRIERDPTAPVHLLAVKGHGYRLVLPAAAPDSGPAAVLAARVEDGATERLWAAALSTAAEHGGYPTGLHGGVAVLVFARTEAAERAAEALARAVRAVGVAVVCGEVRRVSNPLTGRQDFVGAPLEVALRRASARARAAFPDPPAERAAA